MSCPHRPGGDAAYHSMAFPGPWTPWQGMQLPVIPAPQLISCQSWENSHIFPSPLLFHTEVYVSIQEDLLLTRGNLKTSDSSASWTKLVGEDTGNREERRRVKAEWAQVSLNKTSAPRILTVNDADEITWEVLVLTSESHHHKSVFLLGYESRGN